MPRINAQHAKSIVVKSVDKNDGWMTIQEASERTKIPATTLYATLGKNRYDSVFCEATGQYYVKGLDGLIADKRKLKRKRYKSKIKMLQIKSKREAIENKIQERNEKIERLLKDESLTFDDIGARVGMSGSGVWRINQRLKIRM